MESKIIVNRFFEKKTLLFTFTISSIIVPILYFSYKDYKKWIKLGPGGIPSNIFGWIVVKILQPFMIKNGTDTSKYDTNTLTFLENIPIRSGDRPKVMNTIPHRQINQLNNKEIKNKLNKMFYDFISKYNNIIVYKKSLTEKHNNAIFINSNIKNIIPECIHSKGEIAHIHQEDSSMHMIFSQSDAKKVIDKYWGIKHPTAGLIGAPTPSTYIMIYAPRNSFELKIVNQLLKASISYMTGINIMEEI
jgi:hypothetical protein